MTRDANLSALHPAFRQKAHAVIQKLNDEGLPFRIFEGFRSPARQDMLYRQGRTAPGNVVTNARAWESLHQYGLAADFVLYEDGKWSWEDKGESKARWARLHEIARDCGLERLSFEKPHLQLPGHDARKLRFGGYPQGGDASWAENLEQAIASWTGEPGAPPLPDALPSRPPLNTFSEDAGAGNAGPLPDKSGWHSKFGGRQWRHDETGVYSLDREGGEKPWRTAGEPVTMRAILDCCGAIVLDAAVRHGVPASLILMTIATETGFARKDRFTGPRTFRWEPGVRVEDVSVPHYGDYSAGPMQTLATTARWIIRSRNLDYAPFEVAPDYSQNPMSPDQHPLYDHRTNIDIGTAEIAHRLKITGFDPILVAAAYNAGGLYETDANPWRLKCCGDHLDRAAAWYGDACAALDKQ